MTAAIAIFAGLLIAAGLTGLQWIDRRQFGRRNAHGVQVFASYEASQRAHFIEGLVGFISRAAVLIALALFAILGITW